MKPFPLIALLGSLFFYSPAQAVVVSKPRSLETLVKNSGSNSIWVSDGEVKNIEYGSNAMGMETVTLTFEGKVLKGPTPDYVHPVFGAWVKASEEPQTFKVMMLNSEKYPELKNLIAIPPIGSRMTACFTAPNPKLKAGVSSPCGGQENSFFMESLKQGGSVISNSSANKALGIKNLTATNGSESFGKALQAVKGQADDGISKENFNQILQQLIRQYHPVKPAEAKAKGPVEAPSSPSGVEENHREAPEISPEESPIRPRDEEPTEGE